MTMHSPLLIIFRVFFPFAAGYFLSYLYRVVNAVIAPDLIADVGIGPSALGLLTAVYFISFASFQLPLGILLDRYGPRKIEALLLLFAGLGALLFARAESVTALIVGRAFIGFGVSACLMAAFKAFTLWFPRDTWPMVNGFQMAAGGLGALAATAPVESALQFTDWRTVFTILACVTAITSLLLFLVVPEKTTSSNKESFHRQLQGIGEVFSNRNFWQLAPLTTLSQATFMAVQGLWAGPWLTNVALLDRSTVANILLWVAVAMIAGFITLGSLTERLVRRGISVQTTAVTGMVLFMVVQLLLISNPEGWTRFLWMAFGFFGTSGIIAYSALTRSFDVELSGRVTTAINLLVFIAAFTAQWLIGAVISLWPVGAGGELSPEGFTYGFGIIWFLQLLCLGSFFLIKKRRLSQKRKT
ncbi:MAG: MFS transporter [Desulfopila sp.]|jgi:MFS family permease|nr:MFS transporter [Desulfopila sp.]